MLFITITAERHSSLEIREYRRCKRVIASSAGQDLLCILNVLAMVWPPMDMDQRFKDGSGDLSNCPVFAQMIVDGAGGMSLETIDDDCGSLF